MHLRFALARGLFVLLAGAAGLAEAAPRSRPELPELNRLIVEQTNHFRRSQGRDPVKPNAALAQAAAQFADYMARADRYGHEADGREPAQRAQAQGYQYCLVTENIAYQFSSAGFSTAELARRLVDGWIDSPGHRVNMLDADATDTGAAVARSPRSGRYYAVQMFGRPRSLHTVFSIANRSGTALSYEFGGETIRLPPRVTQTHEVCRPKPLSLQLPGQREPLRVQPAHGERYAVERQGTRYRLTQDGVSR